MSQHYTKDHEWVRIEGGAAVCGVSAHAAEQLGDVVYVELPAVGRHVKQGEAMAVVESAKAASDVYAPISGEVIAVNEALADSPQLVNDGAESLGWFVKLAPANAAEAGALMDAAAYAQFLKDL